MTENFTINWWQDLSTKWQILFKECLQMSADAHFGADELKKLEAITALNLAGKQIYDIEPLLPFTQLVSLKLHYNEITDLAPLANMTHLQELWLYNNLILK
jgi:internalin A